jgi:hypothetical protein
MYGLYLVGGSLRMEPSWSVFCLAYPSHINDHIREFLEDHLKSHRACVAKKRIGSDSLEVYSQCPEQGPSVRVADSRDDDEKCSLSCHMVQEC